jgi:hypothetical protein
MIMAISKCSTSEKRWKPRPKVKVYQQGFAFVGQGAIKDTVGFRIGSRTIKRGALK